MSDHVLAEQETPALDGTKLTTVTKAESTVHNTENKPEASRPQNSSYYYWHGHEKERMKVGDVAPMPTPVLVCRDDAAASSAHMQLPKVVRNYQWCDEGPKAISVYMQAVDEEGEQLDEGSVEIEFHERSVRVSFSTVTGSSAVRNRKLLYLPLAKNINPDMSSYRIKSSKQICLKLMKVHDGTWFDLVRNFVSDGDDDDGVGEGGDLTKGNKAEEGEEDSDNEDE